MMVRPPMRTWLAAGTAAVLVGAGVQAVVWSQPVGATPQASAASQAQAVASRPDLVSARIAAVTQGSRVEVTSLEDEYTTTYVNPDGTLTTDTSQAPLRAPQNGAWADVDYTLQHVNGGWEPTASPVPVVFSDGGDQDAVTLGDGTKEIDLSWDVVLPTPTVSGDTATYDLGGGETLVLTANSTGFEQSLVLAQAPTSLPQLKLPFDTSDLTMTADAAGGFVFTNTAGHVVYDMPAPTMYGAAIDPQTEQPLQSKVVAADLTQTAAGARLDLTPSMAWLTDPATAYPVTIDPTVSAVGGGSDTYVEDDKTTAMDTDELLRVGMFKSHAARAYMKFTGLSGEVGKDIQSASLKLYNYDSGSCTAATMHVYPLTSQVFMYNAVWSNKPSVDTASANASSNTFANGNSAPCPNAYVNLDLTKMIAGWSANASTNFGLQLSGTETAGAQYWAFCSMNPGPVSASDSCDEADHSPVLSVTYNSIPGTPTNPQVVPSSTPASTTYSTSSTPILRARIGDADGGTMRGDFQVYPSSGGSVSGSLAANGSGNGSANAAVKWTVPQSTKLTDGTYQFHARGYDGNDYGSWSAWIFFTVDTQAPATPSLSSAQWTSGQWSTSATGSVSWSSIGATSYQYSTDGENWTNTTNSNSSFSFSGDSYNKIQVQAIDAAGNSSISSTFIVGVGRGAMTSPTDGTETQRQLLLTAAGPSGSYVEYQYQLGTTGTWNNVPSSDVLGESSSNAPAAWPWTPAANTDTTQIATADTNWLWNVHNTVLLDGAIEARACFSATASGSNPSCTNSYSTVQLTTGAFDEASSTEPIGPGNLSLVTGDFSVSASDVGIKTYDGELSVSRSLTTLSPTTATATAAGVFGPGWTSSLDGPDAGDGALTPSMAKDKSSVSFEDATGSSAGTYVALSNPAGRTINFGGVGAAADATVVEYYSAATCPASPSPGVACITMSSRGGATTMWAQTGPSTTWTPFSVVTAQQDGAETSTSYYYDANSLPIRIVAPAPSGLDCSTQNKAITTQGCRSLGISYSTQVYGGVSAQRVTAISVTAWDPATSAMSTVALARYDFDTNGRLLHSWDPRISPALMTTYTYTTANRLATIKPPGLNAWTLTYDSSNRLQTASRVDPSGTTATTTIVYDVPTVGSRAPIVLDGSTTAAWGQSADLPSAGVAIFPPTHVPSSTNVAGMVSSDWPWASITYFDYLGRDVDDASFGAGQWQIGATQYDSAGDTTWAITPGNLRQALNPSDDTDPYVANLASSAVRGNLLATVDRFDGNGNIIDEQGPTHPVVVSSGTHAGATVDARFHSVYGYDAGSPNGDYYGLETSDTESAVDVTGFEYDVSASTTGYAAIDNGDARGWDIASPTSFTDPGGLVTQDHYNTAGQLTAEQLPSESGNSGVRTTVVTYYAASGTSACVNAAFAGLTCATQPASQPASGNAIATTTYVYNQYDDVINKTEAYGTGSSKVIRSTAISFDGAERPSGSSVSVAPSSAGGALLPAVSYGYDASTGLGTTSSTGAGSSQQTLMTGYNALGEVTSYSDANGSQSSMSYDLSGRLSTFYDGKGTTSYTYDTNAEHRSEITSEDVGVSGAPSTFTASYDPDGNISTETYPNGLVALSNYDNLDEKTQLQYAKSGLTWMTFTDVYNSDGEIATQASPESTQNFGYDASSRLTSVSDIDGGVCSSRIYSFDHDSNRTALSNYPANADGSCSTSTSPVVVSSTFDQADRITNSGYVYDVLGRTQQVPAIDALGTGSRSTYAGGLQISYFANDMVSKETQGGDDLQFGLDPDQNRVATKLENGMSSVMHYSDDSDLSSWSSTGSNMWTRSISGPDGGLAALALQSGTLEIELENIHGDIIANCSGSATANSVDSYAETTEYGVVREQTGQTPYGYLGSAWRSDDDLGGLVLMGVRLYDPTSGRFESLDAVRNGNANSYTYPADPVNDSDPSGLSTNPGGGGGTTSCHCTARNRRWHKDGRHWYSYSGWNVILSGTSDWSKALSYALSYRIVPVLARISLDQVHKQYRYHVLQFRRCHQGVWMYRDVFEHFDYRYKILLTLHLVGIDAYHQTLTSGWGRVI